MRSAGPSMPVTWPHPLGETWPHHPGEWQQSRPVVEQSPLPPRWRLTANVPCDLGNHPKTVIRRETDRVERTRQRLWTLFAAARRVATQHACGVHGSHLEDLDAHVLKACASKRVRHAFGRVEQFSPNMRHTSSSNTTSSSSCERAAHSARSPARSGSRADLSSVSSTTASLPRPGHTRRYQRPRRRRRAHRSSTCTRRGSRSCSRAIPPSRRSACSRSCARADTKAATPWSRSACASCDQKSHLSRRACAQASARAKWPSRIGRRTGWTSPTARGWSTPSCAARDDSFLIVVANAVGDTESVDGQEPRAERAVRAVVHEENWEKQRAGLPLAG